MNDILIVGAGPIGLYSGFYAAMRGFKGEIIESLNYAGGQLATVYPSKPIYDIPGFCEIKANDFVENLKKQYEKFKDDIPLRFGVKLLGITDKGDYLEVDTSDGKIETKTVLICTGNGDYRPRPLDIKDASNYTNVIYSFKDVNIFKDKNVVVLGGGDSALDFANMIKEVANNTYVVHRRNEFRAHEDSINKFKEKGTILTPYKAVAFDEVNEDKVTKLTLEHVETKEQKIIDVDYIFVNYGNLPSNFDYANLGFKTDKDGLLIDDHYMTNIPGVFAAGNAVSYPSKINTITTGMGEAMTAINEINFRIFPDRNTRVIYSSLLMNKKK